MQVPNEATVTVADFVAHTHRCIITSKKKIKTSIACKQELSET